MRLVIIGGVAGGMSAATRARRLDENAEIVVLEKHGYISFANCGLPYFIAGRIKDEASLLLTDPSKVAARYRIDARVRHEVVSIDPRTKTLKVIDHERGTQYALTYDKLILAPGASPIIPPIEHVRSVNVFQLRQVEDASAVQRYLSKHNPKHATIVGGGFIGLEMAEAMRDRGLEVTLVERNSHALPPLDDEMAVPLHETLERHGVKLCVGRGLKALHAELDQVTSVELDDGTIIGTDMVLMSIGVRPNVALATDAGLKLGTSGAIAVDAYGRTSDGDIYCVGDAAEVTHGITGKPARIPLAGPANRAGRLAGEHAVTGRSDPAGKVLATAIVQVFDCNVGMTGLGERAARQAGFDVDTVVILPAHHVGYYPGAQTMRLKLVYEKSTGKVLGAQIVGGDGVDKRIDVIATAIHFGGTVDDLAQLDLAYAPQFGAAKDPVHIAGFVAQNQRRHLHQAVDANAYLSNGRLLIDVRTPAEFALGSLTGAENIPGDTLRDRLHDIDPARPVTIFCQSGQRGYVAQRLLNQHGRTDVVNLKGGYMLAKEAGGMR